MGKLAELNERKGQHLRKLHDKLSESLQVLQAGQQTYAENERLLQNQQATLAELMTKAAARGETGPSAARILAQSEADAYVRPAAQELDDDGGGDGAVPFICGTWVSGAGTYRIELKERSLVYTEEMEDGDVHIAKLAADSDHCSFLGMVHLRGREIGFRRFTREGDSLRSQFKPRSHESFAAGTLAIRKELLGVDDGDQGDPELEGLLAQLESLSSRVDAFEKEGNSEELTAGAQAEAERILLMLQPLVAEKDQLEARLRGEQQVLEEKLETLYAELPGDAD